MFKSFAFFSLVLLSLNCFPQATDVNSQLNLPKLIPVSPNAASLGKFGDVPVGYYTGVPSISIPLYTISEGDIQLPVTLDYHAGGIKVEEMPSWVGLGWALNCGGVISRSVRGLADEVGVGQKYNGDEARRLFFNQMTHEEAFDYKQRIFNKVTDPESDVYQLSIGTLNAKFFYTSDGKLTTSPRSDIHIEHLTNGWKVTDGKGIQYTFNQYENTTSEPFCSSSSSGSTNNDAYDVITAWYVTQVIDTKGNKIDFNYGPGGIFFKTKSIATRNLSMSGLQGTCPPEFTYCFNYNNVFTGTLNEVSYSGGKITLELSSAPALDNVAALGKIVILDKQNRQVKGYQFHTSYFQTSTVGGCEDQITKRLRLDSLTELSRTNVRQRPYRFFYNSTLLPCRLSNAQDHWGFYNGKDNSIFVRYQSVIGGPWLGADKNPDAAFAKAGTIEKIVYPTGGITEFEFEGNTHSNFAGFDYDDPQNLQGLSGTNTNHNNNYTQTFETTFQVSNEDISVPYGGYVLLRANITKYIQNPQVLSIIDLKVFGDHAYSKTLTTDGDTLHLLPGNYTLQGRIETEFAGMPLCEFYVNLQKIPYKTVAIKPWGGIRVKSIKNYIGLNARASVQEFKYHVFNHPSMSSGVFQEIPEYNYLIRNNAPPLEPNPACISMVYNSLSNYPLLLAGGRPIGYANVTVYYGENGSEGKKEMSYTSFADYPDSADYSFPFPPANSREWRRGLLTKEKTYSYEPEGYFKPIQSKSINYTFHDSDTTKKPSFSVKLAKNVFTPGAENNEPYFVLGLYTNPYLTMAEAFNISSDTVTTYSSSDSTAMLKTVSSYENSRHNFQLKSTSVTDSKNETTTTMISYPWDYTTTSSAIGAAAAIHNMKQKHVVSTPIEQYVFKTRSNGEQFFTGGVLNIFKPTVALPDSVMGFETVKPLALSTFTPSYVNSSGKFIKSPYYKYRLVFPSYSTKGKTLEQKKINDVDRSFLWGYNENVVIAEVSNATAIQIAYSSFEDLADGNWSIAGTQRTEGGITGTKSYNLSLGNITRTGLPSNRIFKVSYWSSGAPASVNLTTAISGRSLLGWTYYEHVLSSGTTQVTIQGSSLIDELRLCPIDAHMTTYTYSPAIGITSVNTPQNSMSFYEYDDFGRLLAIRDEQRNILKKYTYNYRQ